MEEKTKSGVEPEKNYQLNSQAVEDLASNEAPEYSEEELKKYRTKEGFRVPELLKILLLKAWFAGCVCYFIFWGLGMNMAELDVVVVLAVVMGMAIDLLLNNIIRFIEKVPGQNSKWLFVTKKGVLGLILNILYGCLLTACVYMTYVKINEGVVALGMNILGVEPLLFGLFTVAFDMLFIAMKRLLGKILRDARQSASKS